MMRDSIGDLFRLVLIVGYVLLFVQLFPNVNVFLLLPIIILTYEATLFFIKFLVKKTKYDFKFLSMEIHSVLYTIIAFLLLALLFHVFDRI